MMNDTTYYSVSQGVTLMKIDSLMMNDTTYYSVSQGATLLKSFSWFYSIDPDQMSFTSNRYCRTPYIPQVLNRQSCATYMYVDPD